VSEEESLGNGPVFAAGVAGGQRWCSGNEASGEGGKVSV
jgi:hypothetical protein